jgi:glycosyltransferase involved in cell wall biosynthesis
MFGTLVLRRFARWCERTVWRGADVVLAVSDVLGQHIQEVCGSDVKIHIVPNGVDLDRFTTAAASTAIKKRLGLERAIVLGFSGFARSWHGLEWAVDALTELPSNVRLVIVGDGPAMPALLDQARACGVEARVHALGQIRHEDIAAYMGTFDIALQPRAVAYASPLKLFEYMALGRPIVAPDQPNVREILTHEESALLFAPDDKRSFVEALKRLCQDATLRSRLGRAARETVEERQYSWANNAARVEAIATSLIKKSDATI